jgi:NTE family protein
MNDIGLVFSGGGGKGAYEIGVWKTLNKFGGLQIKAVSGTSVGALNAFLYARTSYGSAEQIWTGISRNVFLPPHFRLENYLEFLGKFLGPLSDNPIKALSPALMIDILRAFFLTRDGLFSRYYIAAILKMLITQYEHFTIPCFATCYNCSDGKTESFCLNEQDVDKQVQILLASSALPGIYPSETIDGCKYYDGGIPVLGDNTPIFPLYERGIRKLIVVHLDSNDDVSDYDSKYPQAEIINVFPKIDLGGTIFGMLKFDSEKVREMIDMGAADMENVLRLKYRIGYFERHGWM